jgi:hypothetical protein
VLQNLLFKEDKHAVKENEPTDILTEHTLGKNQDTGLL